MVFTERQKGELKEITKEMSKEVLRELTSDSRFLEVLADKLVNKILDHVSSHIENLKDRIDELEKKVNIVESEKKNATTKCEQLEQHAKLKQLRIYGIPENTGENLKMTVDNIFNSKLNLKNMKMDDCYRIGTSTDNKTRPVIVKFENMQQRNMVYFNKKKLKGSKIAITEELVKSTYELLLFAKENIGKDKVWTIGGRIITKTNGTKVVLRSEEDIIKLMDKNRE